jgi:hypothetical protein
VGFPPGVTAGVIPSEAATRATTSNGERTLSDSGRRQLDGGEDGDQGDDERRGNGGGHARPKSPKNSLYLKSQTVI